MRIKYLLVFAAVFYFIFPLSNGSAQESAQVHIPRLSADIDPQEVYVYELLLLVLKNSGTEYRIVPNENKMQQARSIHEMTSPVGNIDLLWTMATDERETQMIAIKLPIDKGLIGWRIPLVKKEKENLFTSVKTIQNLLPYSAGQEHDWPDVPILKANGLPVITSSGYESLFRMLQAGRFDYFPRSMLEIWNEYSAHPNHQLHIDEHLILHYPSAYYFFVTTRRAKLAEDVRIGFEVIIKDGSFEKLFQKHNQISIKRADIKHRIVIELNNPLFHLDKSSANRPELWFKP